MQGCTYFPKIWEPPQNSRCHTGDMKQVMFWEPTHIRYHFEVSARWPYTWNLCTLSVMDVVDL